MSYSILIPNGILTMCETAFECPVCSCKHTSDDYEDRLMKSKKGLIYKQCKGCKRKLGITTNMMGDVVVWDKSTEKDKP